MINYIIHSDGRQEFVGTTNMSNRVFHFTPTLSDPRFGLRKSGKLKLPKRPKCPIHRCPCELSFLVVTNNGINTIAPKRHFSLRTMEGD